MKIHSTLTSPWAPPFVVAGGLSAALVLQHALNWSPCPLCILQRLTAISLFLLLFLSAYLVRKRPRQADLVLVLACGFALAGVWAGVSHLWVLYEPQSGACGPGVARFVGHLVEALPGSEWLLEGAGACEDTRYQLLGIALPAWSALLHVMGVVWALLLRFRIRMFET